MQKISDFVFLLFYNRSVFDLRVASRNTKVFVRTKRSLRELRVAAMVTIRDLRLIIYLPTGAVKLLWFLFFYYYYVLWRGVVSEEKWNLISLAVVDDDEKLPLKTVVLISFVNSPLDECEKYVKMGIFCISRRHSLSQLTNKLVYRHCEEKYLRTFFFTTRPSRQLIISNHSTCSGNDDWMIFDLFRFLIPIKLSVQLFQMN